MLDSGASTDITGSTLSSFRSRGMVQPASIDDSDWVKLREIANQASSDEMAGTPIGWKNDVTGSNGSLMAFSAPNDGRGKCRSFAATVQNVDGIQRYKGETCTANAKYWKITRFELVDLS